MEEMRSFGYICPECGKPVIASRSVFALTAAAARMECACEKSTLEVQTDGVKFRALGALRPVRQDASGRVQRRRGAARPGRGAGLPGDGGSCAASSGARRRSSAR